MKRVFFCISLLSFIVLSGCGPNIGPDSSMYIDKEEYGQWEASSFFEDQQKVAIEEKDMAIFSKEVALGMKKSSAIRNTVVETKLEYIAKSIAKALKHPGIRQAIREKVALAFDGEYNALWVHICDIDINGSTIKDLVRSRFEESISSNILDNIFDIPLLQIAIPVNFEAWDATKTLLVAFTPISIDDQDGLK